MFHLWKLVFVAKKTFVFDSCGLDLLGLKEHTKVVLKERKLDLCRTKAHWVLVDSEKLGKLLIVIFASGLMYFQRESCETASWFVRGTLALIWLWFYGAPKSWFA